MGLKGRTSYNFKTKPQGINSLLSALPLWGTTAVSLVGHLLPYAIVFKPRTNL